MQFSAWGSPIRKSADRWIFAPPRSLSQLVTSFVGSQCQGIPLVLLSAWTSLKSSNLVLKFVASLHANRKSFEVFPLPFTFVMILSQNLPLTERPSIISISLKIFLFLSYTYLSRIRSICFLLFIFQCSFFETLFWISINTIYLYTLHSSKFNYGGLKWIRTTDLALIRRAL